MTKQHDMTESKGIIRYDYTYVNQTFTATRISDGIVLHSEVFREMTIQEWGDAVEKYDKNFNY